MICLALALLLGSLCDSLLGTFSKTVSVGYIVFFLSWNRLQGRNMLYRDAAFPSAEYKREIWSM
jgi:hypothetical protein